MAGTVSRFASRVSRWLMPASNQLDPGSENRERETGSRKRRKAFISARVVLVAVLAILSLGATDANSRYRELGNKLMCTCGCNQLLLECNHVGCTASDTMRAELRNAVNSGQSDDVVLASFVQKYGPVVLAAPTKTGFNRVAWIMPYLALVLGLALTGVVVRHWKSRPKPVVDAPAVSANEQDALRRRVHEETEL